MDATKKLSHYLFRYGMSIERIQELFDASDRTIARWQHNPPKSVINVISALGNEKRIPDLWKGWYFNDKCIVDPDGNGYREDDIRSLHAQRALSYELVGDSILVSSLKDHLDKQIKKQPVLKISLVDESSDTEVKNWSIAL